MAWNYRGKGDVISITGPSGGLSNSTPYMLGDIPLVAMTDIAEGATGSAGRRGIFKLEVKGADGVGNAAVSPGDQLYYDAAASPMLSKDNGGKAYGKALGSVSAGATAFIDVLLDE